MRHIQLAPLALAACSLLACPKPADEGATAERTQPTPEQQEQPVEQAKPEQATEQKPEQQDSKKKTPPKPKVDEAKQLRKQLLALLNEGRAATKKGDHAAGIAKYREALAIDASDVSVLCELGWAAFQAGDLELAHRSTVQALKFVREDKQRGMILYNLGRIAEAREQIAEAVDDYRASLQFRPGNKTVQERLDALLVVQQQQAIAGSAGGELQGPITGLEVLARDLGDLRAACKLIEEQRCDEYTMFEGDSSCRCEAKLHMTPGADDSWGLLQLDGDDMSRQVAWFPAVKTDKGWTVFAEVLYAYNPGAFGIYEEAQLVGSTVESLLPNSSQLVMRVSKGRADRDMGLNEIETEDHSAQIICARDATGAYCTRALITAYTVTREVEFPEEDGEDVEHPGLPFAAGFAATVEFVDGKLIVKWVSTKGDFEVEGEGDVWSTMGRVLSPGEYELAALLGLPK